MQGNADHGHRDQQGHPHQNTLNTLTDPHSLSHHVNANINLDQGGHLNINNMPMSNMAHMSHMSRISLTDMNARNYNLNSLSSLHHPVPIPQAGQVSLGSPSAPPPLPPINNNNNSSNMSNIQQAQAQTQANLQWPPQQPSLHSASSSSHPHPNGPYSAYMNNARNAALERHAANGILPPHPNAALNDNINDGNNNNINNNNISDNNNTINEIATNNVINSSRNDNIHNHNNNNNSPANPYNTAGATSGDVSQIPPPSTQGQAQSPFPQYNSTSSSPNRSGLAGGGVGVGAVTSAATAAPDLSTLGTAAAAISGASAGAAMHSGQQPLPPNYYDIQQQQQQQVQQQAQAQAQQQQSHPQQAQQAQATLYRQVYYPPQIQYVPANMPPTTMSDPRFPPPPPHHHPHHPHHQQPYQQMLQPQMQYSPYPNAMYGATPHFQPSFDGDNAAAFSAMGGGHPHHLPPHHPMHPQHATSHGNAESMRFIRQINNNDVLCGRGGATNSHIGNRAFRQLVKQYKDKYLQAKKKEKPNVAGEIVDHIRNLDPPGRFLKKDRDTGYWLDIGDMRAKEKTSQALREGAPLLRRKLKEESEIAGQEGDTTKEESDSKVTGLPSLSTTTITGVTTTEGDGKRKTISSPNGEGTTKQDGKVEEDETSDPSPKRQKSNDEADDKIKEVTKEAGKNDGDDASNLSTQQETNKDSAESKIGFDNKNTSEEEEDKDSQSSSTPCQQSKNVECNEKEVSVKAFDPPREGSGTSSSKELDDEKGEEKAEKDDNHPKTANI